MDDLRTTQLAFVQHIRDPENYLPPQNIEERRLAIYRDLLFNNIKGFLSNGFPVLKTLYHDDHWQALCRRFFAEHPCRSPYFVDISKEFVEYLSNSYQLRSDDPPFMAELAHYEWIELAASIAIESPPQQYWQGQPFSAIAMSQLAFVLSYQFPVHQISAAFRPQQPSGPYYFVVHRNSQDKVEFTQINQSNAYMLNVIEQQGEIAVEALLDILVAALPKVDPSQVRRGALQVIEDFLRKQVLVPG